MRSVFHARVVAAALFASLVLYAFPAIAEGGRVAVFPVKNNGNVQYNGMASGIAAMFTTNMSRSEDIEVVEPQAVFGAIARARLTGGAPSTADALRAAKELDAEYAVTGEFVMFGGRFRIDVRVYDVATGQIKFSEKEQDKEDAFFEKVDELSDKIILGIAGTLPAARGFLQINSTPAGATALVDDEEAGETPLLIKSAEPGSHEVTLDLYGYHPYKTTVVVVEGETAVVEAELVPLFGGVRIWWKDQPSSDVSFGDTLIPASTFRFTEFDFAKRYCRNMPAGTYRLTVRMPYKDENEWSNTHVWKTYSEDIEIVPGEVVDVYLFNKLFSPGVQISTCTSCATDWDFDTKVVWYEQAK